MSKMPCLITLLCCSVHTEFIDIPFFYLSERAVSVTKRITLAYYCQRPEYHLVDDWLNSVVGNQNWKEPEELFSCPVLRMRNSRLRLLNAKLIVK